MKILNGKELAGYIKERQAHEVRRLSKKPKLLIIRDSDNPVITKYVNLKIKYGEDIGAIVEEAYAKSDDELINIIQSANKNPDIHGIILQLPIKNKEKTDEITSLIAPEKDVDGLGNSYPEVFGDPDDTSIAAPKKPCFFDSATATAIIWLLAGYEIKL